VINCNWGSRASIWLYHCVNAVVPLCKCVFPRIAWKIVYLYISQHNFEHRPLLVCSLPLNPLKQLVLKPFHFPFSSRDPTLTLFLSLWDIIIKCLAGAHFIISKMATTAELISISLSGSCFVSWRLRGHVFFVELCLWLAWWVCLDPICLQHIYENLLAVPCLLNFFVLFQLWLGAFRVVFCASVGNRIIG